MEGKVRLQQIRAEAEKICRRRRLQVREVNLEPVGEVKAGRFRGTSRRRRKFGGCSRSLGRNGSKGTVTRVVIGHSY